MTTQSFTLNIEKFLSVNIFYLKHATIQTSKDFRKKYYRSEMFIIFMMVPLARTAAAVRARPSCQSCSILFFPAHPYIEFTYSTVHLCTIV
jgi:hypothetical protein